MNLPCLLQHHVITHQQVAPSPVYFVIWAQVINRWALPVVVGDGLVRHGQRQSL
jgi:hypothetical protein